MRNLFLILFLIASSLAFGQINQGGNPSSFDVFDLKNIPLVNIDKPNMDQIRIEDDVDTKQGNIFKYGRSVYTNVDLLKDGSKDVLPNGREVFRIMLHAEEALALGVNFSEFWIPRGGKLFIYNPDKSQVLGAYTSENNHNSNVFAIELLLGSEAIIEYEAPLQNEKEAKLIITELNYAYRGVDQLFNTRDFGDSDYCQVNINCSPEGDTWQDEKKAACRISIKAGFSYGWCSGSLINNTANNCTPYVLTADHCAFGQSSYASANDHNQWIFYFNYEAPACNNPNSNPSSNSITGCSQISYSGAIGGVNGNIGSTSDFYLVELNSPPPQNWGLYYAGWDRSTSPSSSGVSIHHPSGDIKKISTYTSNLANGAWNGNWGGSTHWRVTWSGTQNGHGVTEGGSSGSPIFNSNGHIIGDLSGGSSYCNATSQTDLYGKFSESWDQGGSANNAQLKPWLDPNNTGVIFLNGFYCGTSASASFSSNETNFCGSGPHTATFTNNSSGNISSYNWQFTGGNPSSATGPGPHNVTYSNNGSYTVILQITDNQGNVSQSIQPAYINILDGDNISLDFLPDCYGEENSWVINDDTGNEIFSVPMGYYPGGSTSQTMESNPTMVNHEICLSTGCYDFILSDDYGDGMFGSQHSCDFDGDFVISSSNGDILGELDEGQYPNADFGNSLTLNFCVESSSSSINLINNSCNFYPNPTSGKVEINIHGDFIARVYDVLGNVILETKNNSIDLSNEKNGIYFIEIITNNNKEIGKLILNK